MGARETRGGLRIETWDAATPAAGGYRQRYWPPTIWGLIGTLLIHLLLLPSMLVVTGMNAKRLIESPQLGRSGITDEFGFRRAVVIL